MKDLEVKGHETFTSWLARAFSQFFNVWVKRNDHYDCAPPVAYARIKHKLILPDKQENDLSDQEYEFDAAPILGPHEVVSCSFSRTINLGNYESVNISVFRSMPFHPGRENAELAYEECKKWVAGKVTEQVKKVVEFRDKKNVASSPSPVNKVNY